MCLLPLHCTCCQELWMHGSCVLSPHPPAAVPTTSPAGPILSQAHGGFLLPFITGTWATALLTAMMGLSAPEVAAAAEQEAQAAESAPETRTELRMEMHTEPALVPQPQNLKDE